jgi:glycosyltransferase involved in cell wall biosynthesis
MENAQFPKFTIVIPVKEINDYVRETVPHIQRLHSDAWELIILPNEPARDEWSDARIRLLPSGRVGPGAKRDMCAREAKGEILVFLDDDSYPESSLLEVAERHFADTDVVAIGGPGITPPNDSFWQRVSGAMFLSRLSGGAPERYVPVGPVRKIDDWPSVNLMVRRQDFLAVGGFNTPFWPGEDTKLCLMLAKTGKRILYVPELVVWHHRREGLLRHLKQVGAYGLHRGFFVKKYPETSRRPAYFAPSGLLTLAIVTLGLPWLPLELSYPVYAGWGVYGLALATAFCDISRHETPRVATAAIWYTFLSHLYYGVRFIQGLFTRQLVSKLR